jgi:hypothetical protein
LGGLFRLSGIDKFYIIHTVHCHQTQNTVLLLLLLLLLLLFRYTNTSQTLWLVTRQQKITSVYQLDTVKKSWQEAWTLISYRATEDLHFCFTIRNCCEVLIRACFLVSYQATADLHCCFTIRNCCEVLIRACFLVSYQATADLHCCFTIRNCCEVLIRACFLVSYQATADLHCCFTIRNCCEVLIRACVLVSYQATADLHCCFGSQIRLRTTDIMRALWVDIGQSNLMAHDILGNVISEENCYINNCVS